PAAADGKSKGKVEVKIDFDRIGRRARQLTRTADTVGSLAVAPDSKTLIFTTSGTGGGRSVQSIRSMELDGEQLTRVTQSAQATDEEQAPRGSFGGLRSFTSLQIPKDDRVLFYRQANGMYSIPLGGCGTGPGEPSG